MYDEFVRPLAWLIQSPESGPTRPRELSFLSFVSWDKELDELWTSTPHNSVQIDGGWGFNPPPQFFWSHHCDPPPNSTPQVLGWLCCVTDQPPVNFPQFEHCPTSYIKVTAWAQYLKVIYSKICLLNFFNFSSLKYFGSNKLVIKWNNIVIFTVDLVRQCRVTLSAVSLSSGVLT